MAVLTNTQRSDIVVWCKYFQTHQNLIGYDNGPNSRPFPVLTAAQVVAAINEGLSLNTWDCSASTVELFCLGGAKDPTGYGFRGFGNTEDIYRTLPHYTKVVDAHAAALAIIGIELPLADQHAVIVTKPGSTLETLEVFSHGSAGSCKILTMAEEMTAHVGASIVFCTVGNLG